MTVQDLRDVLRERAEAPSPANPYRHEQIHARVRRTRLRRRVTAGVAAGVAAAMVVAVGVSLLPGAERRPRETTAAAGPAPDLPESFISRDGTPYRRLATVTMRKNGAEKTSVSIPVSGKPLDVAVVCRGGSAGVTPRIRVNGRSVTVRGFARCHEDGRMELQPLIVPEGVTRAVVEFDTTTVGTACARARRDGPCVPVKPERRDWWLGVYEWTAPDRPVDPGPLRAFPGRLGGMKLADSASGLWEGDASFTLVAGSPGGKLGLEQLCTGELAQRMWVTYKVDGKEVPGAASCGIWEQGPFPTAMSEIVVPKGKRVTITGRVGLWGESTNRPVRWSVAAYVK